MGKPITHIEVRALLHDLLVEGRTVLEARDELILDNALTEYAKKLEAREETQPTVVGQVDECDPVCWKCRSPFSDHVPGQIDDHEPEAT